LRPSHAETHGSTPRPLNRLIRLLWRGGLQLADLAATLGWHRRKAHAVTGLPQRRAFVARLKQALRSAKRDGAGLLLVRLCHPDAMKQRIGQAATDRVLAALAQVLKSYPRHVRGALTGRLNRSDFALYLPAPGMAEETAGSLREALRAALTAIDSRAELAIGAAELPLPCDAAAAMSLAAGALARAESGAAVCIAAAAPASR
jgi:GGDEF domain-containing protein